MKGQENLSFSYFKVPLIKIFHIKIEQTHPMVNHFNRGISFLVI